MVSEILSNNCQVKNDLDPCAIVILGATGDLASRKLFPALFDLYISNSLPSRFLIIGCGRTESNDEKFRAHIQNALLKANRFNASKWDVFAKSLFYRPIAYDNADMFQQLSTDLKKLDHAFQTRGNRIFYLALPPALYAPVARMIGQAGLNREHTLDHGWSRLVVEKPFGRDLKNAVELDRQIHQHFQEHQIFRIDHYLAKQTDIVIQFKEIPHSIFRKNLGQPVSPNRLFIGIYPKESIRLTFQTKQPGATICLGDVTMDFDYDRESTLSKMDAYAKVLIDCMSGDQMLFWRQDGIENAWSFLTPILDSCENCSHQDGMPHFYKSGSLGPMASIDLLP